MSNGKMVEVNKLAGYNQVSSGYYWNIEKNELMSLKSGELKRLYGSNNGYGRVYNLQLAAQYKRGYYTSMNIKEADLKHRAKLYLASNPAVVLAAKGSNPDKGWIIGSCNAGVFSFAANPKIHTTESSVNAEIERLAKVNAGKTFVKVKVENYVTAGGVQWN